MCLHVDGHKVGEKDLANCASAETRREDGTECDELNKRSGATCQHSDPTKTQKHE